MSNQKSTSEKKRSIHYYIRIIHRDLGYFLVGMVVVYALSGMLLIYRDSPFMKVDTVVEKKIAPNMEVAQLGRALRIREFEVIKNEGDTIRFKAGYYLKSTGEAKITVKELPESLNRLTFLHKAASKNPSHWFNILFGVLLLYMAISSFWMFKPENKNFRRGIYLSLAGILVVVLLLFLI